MRPRWLLVTDFSIPSFENMHGTAVEPDGDALDSWHEVTRSLRCVLFAKLLSRPLVAGEGFRGGEVSPRCP